MPQFDRILNLNRTAYYRPRPIAMDLAIYGSHRFDPSRAQRDCKIGGGGSTSLRVRFASRRAPRKGRFVAIRWSPSLLVLSTSTAPLDASVFVSGKLSIISALLKPPMRVITTVVVYISEQVDACG